MKKVILILPDKITKVADTSRSVYTNEIELIKEDLQKVLCVE